MKKLIILSLIITSLFIISCKNGSDSSSGGGSGTTTPTTPATSPLEGTWVFSETEGTATASISFVFTGTNIAYSIAESDTSIPLTLSVAVTGTFRLDNGNLYTTLKSASVSDGTNTITTTDPTAIPADSFLPVPVDNAEHLFGTYALNGNSLTVTITDPDTGISTPISLTKQ